MKLLLDSNVLLWSLSDTKRLPWQLLELLEDPDNELFVSRASLWEISIKVAKRKLELPGSSIRSLVEQLAKLEISILPIEDLHILRTEMLPHHHRDPFDRMIVAQAIEEHLTILSADADMALYEVDVMWR